MKFYVYGLIPSTDRDSKERRYEYLGKVEVEGRCSCRPPRKGKPFEQCDHCKKAIKRARKQYPQAEGVDLLFQKR